MRDLQMIVLKYPSPLPENCPKILDEACQLLGAHAQLRRSRDHQNLCHSPSTTVCGEEWSVCSSSAD